MKMIFEILSIIIAVIVLICLSFYFSKIIVAPSPQQYLSGSVCIKENCFSVELATTEAQRDRGLMYRKELDKDKGMLFVFGRESIYPFWMRNVLIPLDMIWIDGNKKIVFIKENAEPCKESACPAITPEAGAKYVLEINAGVSEKFGIKIGDVADLKIGN